MPDPSPRVRYWREQRRRGVPLFAAACASPAEAAACLPLAPDLILFHPAFASAGAAGESGMLAALAPLHNANDEAPEEFAALPGLCAPCPVAMGVCGTDPFLLPGPAFAAWRSAGLEAVANFPTLGLVDGLLRSELEESGLGMAQEIDCLRTAHAGGFCAIGLVCSPEDAAACAEAGCDALIAHLGLTAEYRPRPLSSSLSAWKAFADAVRGPAGAGPLLLLHGDHLATGADEDAWRILRSEGCDGMFAAGGVGRVKALRTAVSGTAVSA